MVVDFCRGFLLRSEKRGGAAFFLVVVTAADPIEDCGELVIRLQPGCVSRSHQELIFLSWFIEATGGRTI
jgi:hypothetical protein